MKTVWLQLQGPQGVRPKAPAHGAWQSPGHVGVRPEQYDPESFWIGLRTDDLVVIDCDCYEAMDQWLAHVGLTEAHTWVRKTPNGWHFIYRRNPGDPDGPSVGVWPKTDIRAGRTGQIVFFAPGYETVCDTGPTMMRDFDSSWLPSDFGKQVTHEEEEWSEMPDGRGNNTMAAFAGAFRKQGMDLVTMVKCLSAINRITMTRDPMDREQVIEIARSVSRYAPRPDIDIELDEG